MTLNIASDFLVFDGLESISYLVRTGEATFAAGVPATALNVTASKSQGGNGKIATTRTTATWHLWQESLGAVLPKITDRFIDSAGATWIVDSVRFDRLTGHYEVEAFVTR